MPTSETNMRAVQPDGSEVHSAVAAASEDHETAGSLHAPLLHALPQLTLLLQLLLHTLLELSHKSPHLLHFHPGLIHAKAAAGAHHALHHGAHHHGGHHHVGGPFYGPGLYGVSATNTLGKGRPFGPYKYEDNA